MISVTNCDATLNKLPELCIWLIWHFDVCFVSYSSWLSCQMACWLRLLRTTPRSPRCRWSSTAGRGLRRATMLESPTACELLLDWYVCSLHISCIGIVSHRIIYATAIMLYCLWLQTFCYTICETHLTWDWSPALSPMTFFPPCIAAVCNICIIYIKIWFWLLKRCQWCDSGKFLLLFC